MLKHIQCACDSEVTDLPSSFASGARVLGRAPGWIRPADGKTFDSSAKQSIQQNTLFKVLVERDRPIRILLRSSWYIIPVEA